jgi:hypothetical protein
LGARRLQGPSSGRPLYRGRRGGDSKAGDLRAGE